MLQAYVLIIVVASDEITVIIALKNTSSRGFMRRHIFLGSKAPTSRLADLGVKLPGLVNRDGNNIIHSFGRTMIVMDAETVREFCLSPYKLKKSK